jgi:hypothetical protein
MKFICLTTKCSVSTSQETHCVSISKTNRVMLFRKNNPRLIWKSCNKYTLWVKWNFFYVKADCTYSSHCALKRQKRTQFWISMQCTYVTNEFFAILLTSLPLMFVYCGYEYVVAKLITLQISHCIKSSYFPLYLVKHLTWRNVFKMHVVYGLSY